MMFLQSEIQAVVKKAYPDYRGPIELVSNNDLTFGDYASSVAWPLAKQYSLDPHVVATDLQKELAQHFGERVTVTISPGVPFVNFTLSPDYWGELIDQKIFEPKPQSSGRSINIEFISANPTGPITLANARGGFYGDALSRILQSNGSKVEREYYNNDSGNQILELGQSIIAAREGKTYDQGYKGTYIKELADKIAETDPYRAGREAAQIIFDQWIRPMIERMGVAFDTYTSEQALVEEMKVDETFFLLQESDLTYEKEGAIWLKSTHFGDDKDRVLRRSDDEKSYTYLMKDIAYHRDKIKRGYDQIFTMVGADHFTEAQTLESVVNKVIAPQEKWEGSFHQPIIQFVRLIDNGEEIKMSKRAGTYVTINDLLDEIPTDVTRFFFLMRDLNSHLDFDLTLARDTSDKNPVYYVQYAFVRAKHILEKAEGVNGSWSVNDLNEEERRLLTQIFAYQRVLNEIVETHEVHKLTYYTIDLAKQFHAFYAKHPVLQAEGDNRSRRLIITKIAFDILKQSLSLLGISHPERMVQTTD